MPTEFRIADTFTDSLARLTGAEQRAAKTTAFDLHLDPTSPGLHFDRLDRARDPNFWSVRVNNDVRDEPAAVLCRASRRGVLLGRAAPDRAPSDDRRGAARPRARAGGAPPASRYTTAKHRGDAGAVIHWHIR
jgi:hypothetical protein